MERLQREGKGGKGREGGASHSTCSVVKESGGAASGFGKLTTFQAEGGSLRVSQIHAFHSNCKSNLSYFDKPSGVARPNFKGRFVTVGFLKNSQPNLGEMS